MTDELEQIVLALAARLSDRAGTRDPDLAHAAQLLRQQYDDLIYQVATKYPNESRHDTAKRYIREREEQGGNSARQQQTMQRGEPE